MRCSLIKYFTKTNSSLNMRYQSMTARWSPLPQGSGSQKKGSGSDFIAGIFAGRLLLKTLPSTVWCAGLTNTLTFPSCPSHVLHISHTHACRRHLLGAVWGFDASPYPRWSVLYPSARHFLLVDDVHELHSVVALHVNHRPLQGILGHLVELKEGGGDVEDVEIQKRRLTLTQLSC